MTVRIEAGDLPGPNSSVGVSRIANEHAKLKEEKALCTGQIKEFFPEEAEMDSLVPFATGNSSWLFTDQLSTCSVEVFWKPVVSPLTGHTSLGREGAARMQPLPGLCCNPGALGSGGKLVLAGRRGGANQIGCHSRWWQ